MTEPKHPTLHNNPATASSSRLRTPASDENLFSSRVASRNYHSAAIAVVDARLCEQHHERHSAAGLTPRGTPLSPTWSPEWIAQVETIEDQLDRRICGAKTPTGNPCRMRAAHTSESDSSHSALPHNGRCNFHGGADLAGGQPGNQNAASHGLYIRGLRPCSQTCPLWDKCPLACNDIADLEPRDRPTCPYELHDYEKAVDAYTQMLAPLPDDDDEFNGPEALITIMKYKEDIEAKRIKAGQPPIFIGLQDADAQNESQSSAQDPQSPIAPHLVELVHRTATLSVMVNRAASAMREADVIDQTQIRSNNYNATYARPHAYLQAYLRLSSEYRRYHAMLKEYAPKPKPKKEREHASLAELLSPIRPRKKTANIDEEPETNATPAPAETGPESLNTNNPTHESHESHKSHGSHGSHESHESHESHKSHKSHKSDQPDHATPTRAPGAPLTPEELRQRREQETLHDHAGDLANYTDNTERFQEALRRESHLLAESDEPAIPISELGPPPPKRTTSPTTRVEPFKLNEHWP